MDRTVHVGPRAPKASGNPSDQFLLLSIVSALAAVPLLCVAVAMFIYLPGPVPMLAKVMLGGGVGLTMNAVLAARLTDAGPRFGRRRQPNAVDAMPELHYLVRLGLSGPDVDPAAVRDALSGGIQHTLFEMPHEPFGVDRIVSVAVDCAPPSSLRRALWP